MKKSLFAVAFLLLGVVVTMGAIFLAPTVVDASKCSHPGTCWKNHKYKNGTITVNGTVIATATTKQTPISAKTTPTTPNKADKDEKPSRNTSDDKETPETPNKPVSNAPTIAPGFTDSTPDSVKLGDYEPKNPVTTVSPVKLRIVATITDIAGNISFSCYIKNCTIVVTKLSYVDSGMFSTLVIDGTTHNAMVMYTKIDQTYSVKSTLLYTLLYHKGDYELVLYQQVQ